MEFGQGSVVIAGGGIGAGSHVTGVGLQPLVRGPVGPGHSRDSMIDSQSWTVLPDGSLSQVAQDHRPKTGVPGFVSGAAGFFKVRNGQVVVSKIEKKPASSPAQPGVDGQETGTQRLGTVAEQLPGELSLI